MTRRSWTRFVRCVRSTFSHRFCGHAHSHDRTRRSTELREPTTAGRSPPRTGRTARSGCRCLRRRRRARGRAGRTPPCRFRGSPAADNGSKRTARRSGPARAGAGPGRRTTRIQPRRARTSWARSPDNAHLEHGRTSDSAWSNSVGPARTPRGARSRRCSGWRCCSQGRRRRWGCLCPRSRASSRRKAASSSSRCARCTACGGTTGCTRHRA